MKKINFLILPLLLFSIGLTNAHANTLYSIDVNGFLDENGTLEIKEDWNMNTTKDTEIYKEMYDLGNINIKNFAVRDENRIYTRNDNWNINNTFQQKKYTYGINYVDKGQELCFGISEYGKKTYTMSYDLENAVFKTNDADVLYLRLINDLDFPPERFSIEISSNENFQNDLDVWGYGYKGYAYVDNGKIYMSSEENTKLKKGEYAVLLVKFPLGTFNIDPNNTYSYFQSFDDVLERAKDGTYQYDYSNEEDKKSNNSIFNTIIKFWPLLSFIIIVFIVGKANQKYKFGKAGSKIKMKEINNFRDIPCDKNICKAFFITQVYKLNKRNTDFFGSILLKWLHEDKIKIQKITKDKLIGTKEETVIDLTNFQSQDKVENNLYQMMFAASNNGILEEKQFEKYSKTNYKKVFDWLEEAEEHGCNLYVEQGLITNIKNKYLIDDKLKDDAIKVAGLKKYLKEFSLINEKQPMEVKLWKEYLMFAQMFGIADKVANQFKKLYPEVLTDMQNYNYNINDIILIQHFSYTATTSATSARSAAENYSSGGGGFSSGGGGGGSFGGGGGGSR